MDNFVSTTRPFNALPIAVAKNRSLQSRSQVSPTTFRRIVEYFFRSQPARIDDLTPHLQYDIGLRDFYNVKGGASSRAGEDYSPDYR
jgi:hypothetical protein